MRAVDGHYPFDRVRLALECYAAGALPMGSLLQSLRGSAMGLRFMRRVTWVRPSEITR